MIEKNSFPDWSFVGIFILFKKHPFVTFIVIILASNRHIMF